MTTVRASHRSNLKIRLFEWVCCCWASTLLLGRSTSNGYYLDDYLDYFTSACQIHILSELSCVTSTENKRLDYGHGGRVTRDLLGLLSNVTSGKKTFSLLFSVTTTTLCFVFISYPGFM